MFGASLVFIFAVPAADRWRGLEALCELLRPWDLAAGVPVAETGGGVTNLDGSALYLDARKVLASNGKLHRAMHEAIAKAWPEADRRQAENRAAP